MGRNGGLQTYRSTARYIAVMTGFTRRPLVLLTTGAWAYFEDDDLPSETRYFRTQDACEAVCLSYRQHRLDSDSQTAVRAEKRL